MTDQLVKDNERIQLRLMQIFSNLLSNAVKYTLFSLPRPSPYPLR